MKAPSIEPMCRRNSTVNRSRQTNQFTPNNVVMQAAVRSEPADKKTCVEEKLLNPFFASPSPNMAQ